MTFKMPKIGSKIGKSPRLPHRGIRTAFGSGPHAFSGPGQTMAMPDQAVTAAMAMPQGADAAPTMPLPSPAEG